MALVPLTLISEQESINMTMKYGKVFNKFGLMTIAMAFAGMVYAGSEPAPPNQPFRLSQPSIKGSLVFLPAASCGRGIERMYICRSDLRWIMPERIRAGCFPGVSSWGFP